MSSKWAKTAGGPSSFDLRSDTMTTPNFAMLAAIQNCSLDDDVMREDGDTNELERYMAELTGKESSLFVLSGTMGNQLGLRSLLTQPPYAVLADSRAHILNYESSSVSSMAGALLVSATASNNVHLTLEDIKRRVSLSDDVHTCPTRVISLENTLNGMLFPLDEIKRISAFARENDIKMHCDGARLWEAAAAGAGSLKELCEPFDTVTMCFSKGLGAPVGAILVGSAANIKHARWVRKAIGGGVRQPGLLTAAARVAVDQTFGAGPNGEGGKLQGTHKVAKQVEKMWTAVGGTVMSPVHTNMVWLDLDAIGCPAADFVEILKEQGLKTFGPRLVVHYQVAENAEEVLKRLEVAFAKTMAKYKNAAATSNGPGNMYSST
ncbi:hypothetical protein TD95_003670 [Thielaviopsis punctulata]|uniref:Aromatic amino acid beta-eliminating lyase/threonine aldolase domain-containing protein n=1 Tax=Thielaviopsis punctulata TaxID=72032 RepID=A0A0F4ZJL7_9PEZI|nr:hypothetical protein TD95_003670 [Thielaviopsis punctulata]